VVDLGGQLRAPGLRARPAEGLVAQHLVPYGLPPGRPVDASYGAITLDTVVRPVGLATGVEDPSKRARLRRHDASGHARWDGRGGILPQRRC
jgi:hypothetical protein